MSFTCTRAQDSIPCDSSPNYFYLNKRNGDPKAYFLTDDDIVKPTDNSKFAYQNTNLQSFTPANIIRPVLALGPSSSYGTSTPVASNQRPVKVRKSYEPTERTSFYNYEPSDKRVHDYDRNSLSIGSSSSYSSKAVEPSEGSYKYGGQSKIKPGVKYSKKLAGKSRYEPMKKTFRLDLPQSSYVEDIRPEGNYLSRSETNSGISNVQFQSIVGNYKPKSSSSKIDQLLANYGTATDANSEDTFGYHRAAIESPKFVTVSSAAQPKRSTFTPAAFSKMYMESQKSKFNTEVDSSSSSSQAMSSPSNDLLDNRPSRTNYYPKLQKMEDSQARSPSYSAAPYTPQKAPRSHSSERPAKGDALAVSKYDSHPYEDTHSLIKSSQYIVPSSIRIIDGSIRNGKDVVPLSADSAPNEDGPVKMSFVSKRTNGERPMSDFGNVRVVKQVKGKNLLIDPSLENDPARDNIIAQVLEMLNKYN